MRCTQNSHELSFILSSDSQRKKSLFPFRIRNGSLGYRSPCPDTQFSLFVLGRGAVKHPILRKASSRVDGRDIFYIPLPECESGSPAPGLSAEGGRLPAAFNLNIGVSLPAWVLNMSWDSQYFTCLRHLHFEALFIGCFNGTRHANSVERFPTIERNSFDSI